MWFGPVSRSFCFPFLSAASPRPSSPLVAARLSDRIAQIKMFASTKQIVRAVPAMARGMANKNTTAKVFVDKNTRSEPHRQREQRQRRASSDIHRRCTLLTYLPFACVMCACALVQRDLPGIHRKAGANSDATDGDTTPAACRRCPLAPLVSPRRRSLLSVRVCVLACRRWLSYDRRARSTRSRPSRTAPTWLAA